MSSLRRIIDDLSDTEAVEAKLRQHSEASGDEILCINLESVAKRRADLIHRLDYELHVQQQDLVQYNIMRPSENYPAIAVARSVLAFQELVTSIFDALRSGPKLRFRPSPENLALSSLEFAAARSGSVAVSLHIPNERMMLVESDLDQTFCRLFRLLSSRKQEQFRDLVATVGVASISKAYAWAEVSTAFGLDTSIQWGKKIKQTEKLEISHGEALSIREAIDATSDEDEKEEEHDCLLEGIDPSTSYFHVHLLDGSSIKGGTADTFPRIEWTTQRHYRAELTCKTVIRFSTGEEKVTWTLRNLTPI